MKRILTILSLAAAFLTACQEESLLNPAASLFSPKPELTDTTAIFRLAVANIEATEKAITFPVRFDGDAEYGVDYTVSADAFVFGGESPVDSIVVTTLKLGTEKTLSMTVSLPEGFEAGKYLTSGYTLQDKFAYVSFSKAYTMTADSTDLGFQLTEKSGNTTLCSKDVDVFMSVNNEKSTAEEGVDFEFSDSSYFTIRAGETDGVLEIKSLKPVVEPGRDRIVISLSVGEKFGEGQIHEMEISLLDGIWSELDGTWVADSLVTDSLYMENYWKEAATGYSLMPEYDSDDYVTADMKNCTMNPRFSSSFRYYFTGQSQMRKGEVIDLELPDGNTAPVQTFIIDNTNRFFSPDEISDDKESYIGLRFIPGETEDEKLLYMYILDHTSKSFMPELEASGKYSPEKPVAASPGLYLNIIFGRE